MGHWLKGNHGNRLRFHILAVTVGLLLGRAALLGGTLGALGLLVFVENGKCLVDFLAQFGVVVDPELVNVRRLHVFGGVLTTTAIRGCPSPTACR